MGGPFEASDILHNVFGEEHEEDVILAAVANLESDGTTEWAPAPSGEYYEHPDPDGPSESTADLGELTASALERLSALEAIVAALPGLPSQLGHNAPPTEVGVPPYTDEDARAAKAAIIEVRTALESGNPDAIELETIARRFDGWGAKITPWLAKKADLAVDELINNSVRAFTWTQAAAAFAGTAGALIEVAKHLLAAR